jgi:hypothetical protein
MKQESRFKKALPQEESRDALGSMKQESRFKKALPQEEARDAWRAAY